MLSQTTKLKCRFCPSWNFTFYIGIISNQSHRQRQLTLVTSFQGKKVIIEPSSISHCLRSDMNRLTGKEHFARTCSAAVAFKRSVNEKWAFDEMQHLGACKGPPKISQSPPLIDIVSTQEAVFEKTTTGWSSYIISLLQANWLTVIAHLHIN